MTSSNGKIFSVAGPLCGEVTGHRWIPRTTASDAELLCFLWSEPWINSWVNNREAGDLRSHRAHYDAIVMSTNFQMEEMLRENFFLNSTTTVSFNIFLGRRLSSTPTIKLNSIRLMLHKMVLFCMPDNSAECQASYSATLASSQNEIKQRWPTYFFYKG